MVQSRSAGRERLIIVSTLQQNWAILRRIALLFSFLKFILQVLFRLACPDSLGLRARSPPIQVNPRLTRYPAPLEGIERE